LAQLGEILPAKEINDKGYDHADEQASDYGKVKGKPLAAHDDIPRQVAKPGNLSGK
jgi:hypothetical protein